MIAVRVIVGMLFIAAIIAFVSTVLCYSIFGSDGHVRGGLTLFGICLVSSVFLFGGK